MKRYRLCLALALAGALTLAAPLAAPARPLAQATVVLRVDGSSDIAALVWALADRYMRAHPDTHIAIDATTGGQGIMVTCIHASIPVAIGMSDAYLQDSQLGGYMLFPGNGSGDCRDLVNIPVAIGAVPVIYNLPDPYFTAHAKDGVTPLHPVRLTAQVLASIYLGTVTRWDAPAIAALNPEAPLPAATIQVFHDTEPDGVGTTFSEWLARSDPRWLAAVGVNPQPAWPDRSDHVSFNGVTLARAVATTPYSLGFSVFDARTVPGVEVAALRNAAGAFVTPSPEGLVHAAAAAVRDGMPRDFRKLFDTSSDPAAYDPSYFAFLVVHRDLSAYSEDPSVRQATKDFLNWVVAPSGGQQVLAPTAASAHAPRSSQGPSTAYWTLGCAIGTGSTSSTSDTAALCGLSAAAAALVGSIQG